MSSLPDDQFDMSVENLTSSQPFTVLTANGWLPNISFNGSIKLTSQDSFNVLITKKGDVFVSGGIIPNMVLNYNFESEKWTQLQSLKVERASHSCENIIHGSDQG